MTDEEIRVKAIEYAIRVEEMRGEVSSSKLWQRIADSADYFERIIKKQ